MKIIAFCILLAGPLGSEKVAESAKAEHLVPVASRFRGHVSAVAEGFLLIRELSCAACHGSTNPRTEPKRGPVLDGISGRLSPDWVRAFLLNPQQVKPGTTMPAMFPDLPELERKTKVDALVRFLFARPHQPGQFELKLEKTEVVEPHFWNLGNRQRGEQLYHEVGCVACHTPESSYATDITYLSDKEKLLEKSGLTREEILEVLRTAIPTAESVPLPDLPSKYGRKSLTFFLLNPLRIRPSGRMPSLRLAPDEAAAIAAYLMDDRSPALQTNPTGSVALGKKVFEQARCANCHRLDKYAARSSVPLAKLPPTQFSCPESTPNVPHFALGPEQRKAISEALKNLKTNRDPANPAPALTDRLLSLNCYACHRRDSMGGVDPNRWTFFVTRDYIDIGDEGRIPPDLTGVGGKLLPGWTQDLLAGKLNTRPHLLTRMPLFGSKHTAQLPNLFRQVDGPGKPGDWISNQHTDEGRQLVGQICIQCHRINGDRLAGVEGIDIGDLSRRIEPAWFYDFLLNPAALKPGTRMPTIFADGKSTVTNILAADPKSQIAAMWSYLSQSSRQGLPKTLIAGRVHNFELVPEREPILLRTFMEHVGTHALAVGFPDGVHFGFDTRDARLSIAWRGKFLDAHGTWFDRFTPLANPLGNDLVHFPDGTVVSRLKKFDSPWPKKRPIRFDGFRIDSDGVPVLLYSVSGIAVQDQMRPDGRGLHRTLTLRSATEDTGDGKIFVRALHGRQLAQQGGWIRSSAGLGVQTMPRGEIVEQEYRVTVPPGDITKVEIRYSW